MLCSLENVAIGYENNVIISGVNLKISKGEVILLLGSNGSGKSTLLKTISGLLSPLLGKINKDELIISFCGHKNNLYKKLTVNENLTFFHKLRNEKTPLSELLVKWELHKNCNKSISELSQGQRQKVTLCRTFMGNSQLILLDEPTSNLDEKASLILINEIILFKLNSTIIIASHDINKFIPIATRIILLKDNLIVADANKNEFNFGQMI
jgi:ABC-type multidrug transport system ATPase subunit